ncbi:MAG: tetratricopeptide repeat protein [Bradymonadia bacterium]
MVWPSGDSSAQNWRQSLRLIFLVLLTGCATLEFNQARNHLGLGRYSDAIESLEQLKTLDAPPDGIDQVLAESYRAHAADLIGRGDCVNAGKSLAKALSISEPNVADRRALERCLLLTELDVNERIIVLEFLVTWGERHGPILREYAMVSLELGKIAEALTYAQQAHARYALKLNDFGPLAYAFAAKKHPNIALKFLGLHLRYHPDDALARLKAARLAGVLGRVDLEHKHYLRLAQDNPSNPVVFIRLARFCKRNQMMSCYYDAKEKADALRGIRAEPRDLRPLRKSRR